MDNPFEDDGSSVSLSFVFDADTTTSQAQAQGPGPQEAQQLTSITSDYNFSNSGYGYYHYDNNNMAGTGNAGSSNNGGSLHYHQQQYCFHGQPQIEPEQSSVITAAPGYLHHHPTIPNQMGNMRPRWFNGPGPGDSLTTSNTTTHTHTHSNSMVSSSQQHSLQTHGAIGGSSSAPTFPHPLMPNQQIHFGSNWFGYQGDQPPSYFNKASVIQTHNTGAGGSTQPQPILPPPNVSLPRPRASSTQTKKVRPLWVGQGEPPLYPRGLEVLWREVPPDCQKLINPSDVPPTARYRGYFTVCELLILKRLLIGRLYGVELKPLPPSNCNGRATSRRAQRSVSASASASATVNVVSDSSDALVIDDGSDGVGEAVKEALGILGESQSGNNNNNQSQNQSQQND